MKKSKLFVMALFWTSIALIAAGCPKGKPTSGANGGGRVPKGGAFRVFIVTDVSTPKMDELKKGLLERLDAGLAESGSSASYETFETKLDAETAAGIRDRIEKAKPDLVLCLNNPSGFADRQIVSKLKGTEYRFVSEDPVPVQNGTIASWEKPGGNVAGVGVFVQLGSTLKLVKKVLPGVRKVYSYSWDKMTDVNAWWETELRRACSAEGIVLERFDFLKSHQAEIEYAERNASPRKDMAILVCVSPYVNEDGTLVDVEKAMAAYAVYLQRKSMNPYIAYEDEVVKRGALMGACVVWSDLGAQMAELGLRVLSGEDPGSIPWQYPRKFNVIVNKRTADRLGISLPREIVDAAYRIYTDYEGSFMGR